jgi:hypothetical protein
MDNKDNELDELLEGIAARLNISKTEVIHRGVRLLDLACLEAEKAQTKETSPQNEK